MRSSFARRLLTCAGVAGVAGVLMVPVAPGTANEPAAAASAVLKRGQDIAEGRCARCHAVGRDGPSPQRIATPLRDLHARFPIDMLIEALKSGSIAGHDEMPGFDLGLSDVRALLTYIDSFAPAGRRYVVPPEVR